MTDQKHPSDLSHAHGAVSGLGYPALRPDLPVSHARFPEGAAYRIEIPSCEGPAVMRAVVAESAELGVKVDRVSQGSGVMMLTDDEITEMVDLGEEEDIEVCLFLGPRGAWGTGGQAKVSAAVGGTARGGAEVTACVADAQRAVRLGVRSLLVGDLGVLALLGRMKRAGALPEDLVLKTSVLMPLTNAPTAVVYEQMGANSLNVSTDLELATLAEIRAAVTSPIDVYVEVPDDQGGSVRFYEVPDLVRHCAPVFVKLGVRNAPNIYPTGRHHEATAIALGRERVHRAALVLRLMEAEGLR
ncbi:U32 family peptidase [Nocardioides sp. NPDC058538]|uniref:U32 family peptidase n=1 Tax=Nocardioides sp. NPDC058538 TaxID=3346542 RepID=UPI003652EE57